MMALNTRYKRVLVIHKEGFQQHMPSRCWEMIKNANTFQHFLTEFNRVKNTMNLHIISKTTRQENSLHICTEMWKSLWGAFIFLIQRHSPARLFHIPLAQPHWHAFQCPVWAVLGDCQWILKNGRNSQISMVLFQICTYSFPDQVISWAMEMFRRAWNFW